MKKRMQEEEERLSSSNSLEEKSPPKKRKVVKPRQPTSKSTKGRKPRIGVQIKERIEDDEGLREPKPKRNIPETIPPAETKKQPTAVLKPAPRPVITPKVQPQQKKQNPPKKGSSYPKEQKNIDKK